MDKMTNIPPKLQYSLVEPFSDNVWSNINQVFKMLFPDGSDMEVPLIDPTGIAPAGRFFEITYNSNYVTISPGICVINGVLIEIDSSKTLPVNNKPESYFLSGINGDGLPLITNGEGPYYVYVAIYYDPTDKKDAYITLVGRHAQFDLFKDKMCVLGILKCYYRNPDLTIEGFQNSNPNNGVGRQYLPGFMDGGWIYEHCLSTNTSVNWNKNSLDVDIDSTDDILDGGTYV